MFLQEESVHLDRVDLVRRSLRTYLGMDLVDAAKHVYDIVRYTDNSVLNAAINRLGADEQVILDDILDRCDQIVEGLEDFD